MDSIRGYVQMIDKKSYKRAIALPLEKAGLVKKGQSWYLDGKDTTIVINLQKSNWDDMYYMNIGIWLKAFGEGPLPRENQCHLSYRVESLFPEYRELIFLSSSLENSDTQLLAELSKFIETQLVPLLRELTNEKRLRELMTQGKLDRGLVRLEARMYLSEN